MEMLVSHMRMLELLDMVPVEFTKRCFLKNLEGIWLKTEDYNKERHT